MLDLPDWPYWVGGTLVWCSVIARRVVASRDRRAGPGFSERAYMPGAIRGQRWR